MIFFGTRGRTVNGHLVKGVQCPECGKDEHVTFGVMRYFHVYWIPMFPTQKSAGIQCVNCKATYMDKELSKELGHEIKNTLFTKKRVAPMFAGLMILALLFVFGYVAAINDNKQEIACIQQPQVNDYYLVNFTKIFDEADGTFKYGLMRVKSVAGEEIELMVGTMGYNKTSGPRQDIKSLKVNEKDYYLDETFLTDVEALKQMKEEGAIYSVERI